MSCEKRAKATPSALQHGVKDGYATFDFFLCVLPFSEILGSAVGIASSREAIAHAEMMLNDGRSERRTS
jgi:hypothetical protein